MATTLALCTVGVVPLKVTFGAPTCKLRGSLVHPKTQCAKKTGSLRLVNCSLEPLQGGSKVRGIERCPVWLDVGLLLDGLSTVLPHPQNVGRRPTAKPRVILIAGPTAVEKTRLSIELAKELGGEIINLDFGAAKTTTEERQGIPHHLIEVVPPTVEYTYDSYVAKARAATQDILSRGRVPIVIGGTGMYMRAFMRKLTSITSPLYSSENLTYEGDADLDSWDVDFHAYHLYEQRVDLFPRLDVRCEVQIPELLEEMSGLLDLGLRSLASHVRTSIGFKESIKLLVDARMSGGVISEERFLKFLAMFQHSSRNLAVMQSAWWWRESTRSDMWKFRLIRAGLPVEEMVGVVADEDVRPAGSWFEEQSRKELLTLSLKEQECTLTYKPALQVYYDEKAVASVLKWIKGTQGPN